MLRIEGIKHSGVLCETESAVIIFDYWKGELPEFPSDKPLYVFSSHSHGDHFSKKIFEFRIGRMASTTYILSDDIPVSEVPADAESYMIHPHEEVSFGSVSVKTLRSNDIGVAFLVETDGLKLYFAGDLNNWHWGVPEEDQKLERIYHEELETIRGTVFDAAFVPLDPRLNDAFSLGIEDFMRYCDAKRLIPIHMWGRFWAVDRLRGLPSAAAFADRLELVMKK